MMSTQVQKSRQKCCVYFGAEEHLEIGADIFVAPWDLITPPRVMHYHFATRSWILCARQALSIFSSLPYSYIPLVVHHVCLSCSLYLCDP